MNGSSLQAVLSYNFFTLLSGTVVHVCFNHRKCNSCKETVMLYQNNGLEIAQYIGVFVK
jgi:hypothetical protein